MFKWFEVHLRFVYCRLFIGTMGIAENLSREQGEKLQFLLLVLDLLIFASSRNLRSLFHIGNTASYSL